MGVMRRRRATILVTTLLFALIAAGVSSLTMPMYRAGTEILLVDVPRPGPIDQSDPLAEVGARDTAESVGTQIELLQCGDVVGQALDEVGIPMPRTAEEADKLPVVLAAQVRDTNVVEVYVDASSKEVAQKLATALPRAYGRYVQASQRNAIDRALTFVQGRERSEMMALERATSNLSRFSQANHVSAAPSELGLDQALAGLPHARNASLKLRADLPSPPVARRQGELIRAVREHENALTRIDDLSARLTLHDNSLVAPVEIITKPGSAMQVAPDWGRNMGEGLLLGLLVGLLLAWWRDATLAQRATAEPISSSSPRNPASNPV